MDYQNACRTGILFGEKYMKNSSSGFLHVCGKLKSQNLGEMWASGKIPNEKLSPASSWWTIMTPAFVTASASSGKNQTDLIWDFDQAKAVNKKGNLSSFCSCRADNMFTKALNSNPHGVKEADVDSFPHILRTVASVSVFYSQLIPWKCLWK